jgi:DNA-binding CsgD family transcriptional regulator
VLEPSCGALALADALVALGSALRRDRAPADAREPLRRGLDLATRCGAGALADRAREELLAAGGRPRRDALSGRGSLTASERRVAAMAAEGLGNREIAQALFLSVKTIEVHLTRAYRKLGVASRAELPRALANREGSPSAGQG